MSPDDQGPKTKTRAAAKPRMASETVPATRVADGFDGLSLSVVVPAFNEDINTITGQPHGHILYSWNSGYAWLRKMFRQRLQRTSDDPVDTALNRKLGIIRDSKKMLRLSSAQLK